MGEYPQAIEQYEKALELSPDHLDILWNLSNAFLEGIEDSDRAIEIYEQIMRIAGDVYALVRLNMGRAYYQKGNYDEALIQYERSIELDSSLSPAYNNIAYIYADVLETRLDEAIVLTQKALELEGDGPNRPYYLHTLGWVYHKMGRYREALDVFAEAEKDIPEYDLLIQHMAATQEKAADS